MLDVHALHVADRVREPEHLRLVERRDREPAVLQPAPASARSADQITGGLRHSSMVVQMENDGAKIGSPSSPTTSRLAPSRTPSSSIALNRWSAAYRAKTSDSPGSTPMPTRASCPPAAHDGGLRELLVAQLHAGQLVRPLGVRVRQRHRHVEVVRARRPHALEDRQHEPRVDRVQHVRRPVLAHERLDGGGARRVDHGRGEPAAHHVVRARRLDGPLRAPEVHVGHHEPLEERAAAPRSGRPRRPPRRYRPPGSARGPASDLSVSFTVPGAACPGRSRSPGPARRSRGPGRT